MKKSYINPTMAVIKIQTQKMLAESVGGVHVNSENEVESVGQGEGNFSGGIEDIL